MNTTSQSNCQIWIKSVLLTTTLITFTACGNGFQTGNLASCVSTGCQQSASATPGSGGGTGGSTNSAWNDLTIDGAVTTGQFDKTSVLSLDKEHKMLLVRLPMLLSGSFGSPGLIEIPQLKGAQLTFEPLPNGNIAAVLHIPLSYVMHGADFLPPGKLPNGDPLPAVADGELPSLALAINTQGTIKANIYLGKTVIGLYVNSPVDPHIDWYNIPIKNKKKEIMGYLDVLRAKQGFNGGFFITVKIPDKIARIIDDNL